MELQHIMTSVTKLLNIMLPFNDDNEELHTWEK
jgi:hypothetical protein